MLSTWGLTKEYAGQTVIDGVSFELVPGTVTALLGPVGAGKSTLLRMICGLTTPTEGTAQIGGRAFAEWPNPAQVAGVLLDAVPAHPGRTGLMELTIAAWRSGLPRRRAVEAAERVGLADVLREPMTEYSLGRRVRLGLARAMLANPPALILDNPLRGLEPDAIGAVRAVLRGHAQRGGTVLMTAGTLTEVDKTADRVLVLDGGRILADGALSYLTASERCLVRAADMAKLGKVLLGAEIVVRPGVDGHLSAHASVDRVSEVAYRAGLPLVGLRNEQMGIDDLVLRLTAGARR
ncbi:ATP-binding cassette domain-containing protein [Pseudonocardiaceae bacterium YIM PH 21723]|nr:ATP-binding cassette domain-containing protein [Pseudonocardiaceae bacterium YIM PH 21723]